MLSVPAPMLFRVRLFDRAVRSEPGEVGLWSVWGDVVVGMLGCVFRRVGARAMSEARARRAADR